MKQLKPRHRNIKAAIATIILLAISSQLSVNAQDNANEPSAKAKVWWFHGATEATRKGIRDDLRSFAKAGIGGVVYYDQVHEAYGNPSPVFSPDWWAMLKYSAKEARRQSLTFEVNISNGYVAGGPWIDADHAMQHVVVSDTIVTSDGTLAITLPTPPGSYHDIAITAFPVIECRSWQYNIDGNPLRSPKSFSIDTGCDTTIIRAITIEGKGRAKSPTSAMNIPCLPGNNHIIAANFTPLPPMGELQASTDGKSFRKLCDIPPIYNNMGWKLSQLTLSVPLTIARYYRLSLHDWANGQESDNPLTVTRFTIAEEPTIDRWEEKTGNHSDFISYNGNSTDDCKYPKPSDIIILKADTTADGRLSCTVPRGRWRISRFGYAPTGAKIKHGRRGMTGFECDRLSADAAMLQYRNYFKRIADSLSLQGTPPLGAVCDSHEAGTQNWTKDFESEFERRNGYSLLPWLPTLRGHIIGSRAETEAVLKDYRSTISDMVTRNFFGTIDSLCRHDGYTFTAQAMGNGMCFPVDNIAVKAHVGKPQGEFWTYQKLGAYDIKDAASAAHVYGKPIASAESFTDCPYTTSFDSLKSLADFALCMGVNEFVVCASPYQPAKLSAPLDFDSPHPYALNRNNPKWNSGRWLWKYLEKCCETMRTGRPAGGICICLGSEVPMKLLSYRLPPIPEGYSWDVCTADALLADNSAFSPNPSPHAAHYELIAIEDSVPMPIEAIRKLTSLARGGMLVRAQRAGLEFVARHYGMLDSAYTSAIDSLFAQPTVSQKSIENVLDEAGIKPEISIHSDNRPDSRVYFAHRIAPDHDIFFVYNRGKKPFSQQVTLRNDSSSSAKESQLVELWNPKTNRREHHPTATFHLKLAPEESVILRL